ncbi:MAG TPA: acylneuraminate cytidylyltransferase, partial [Anaerolineales bacterium]|nr:acylneuraminate cytidylyltransferase [Anaerolineales bacterium]
ETLALIPARGGSKGIPRKNIRLFAGYPLIAWSIAAAKQSTSVRRVIVSTDDPEIAAIAREHGAETPFLRPAEIAQDNSLDLPLFEQALQWLEQNEGYKPDVLIQLRPTSPIRPRDCVDNAVKILLEHDDADCVRGVVSAGQNPHKMWRFVGEGKPMKPLLQVEGIAEPYNAPRQILPPVYWQTGHIDAIRATTIKQKKSLTGDAIYPLMIDPRYTVDIDNLSDWAKYEALALSGLEMVTPGKMKRSMPDKIDLIICDFDGVLTDNRVWVDRDGRESVAAFRSDSIRVKDLRAAGIDLMILSSEVDAVVAARARKMGVEAVQGVAHEKGRALLEILEQKNIKAENVVFVGNDLNDLSCFDVAGWSVAVADAYPEVLRTADFVLTRPGGHGAVRELIDLLLSKK